MLSDVCFETRIEMVEALVRYAYVDYTQDHIDEALEAVYALTKLQGRLDYPQAFGKLSDAKYEEHIRAGAKSNIARLVQEAIVKDREGLEDGEKSPDHTKLLLGVSKLNGGKS